VTHHVPIPDRERQRRLREHRRRGVFVTPVEVTGEIVEAPVKRGDLDEADARDLDSVGEAIAAAERTATQNTGVRNAGRKIQRLCCIDRLRRQP